MGSTGDCSITSGTLPLWLSASRMFYESVKKMISLRPYSNAPLRPPRVICIGPCGSGRSTQCQMIAKHYGCVNVDIAALVKDLQETKKSAVAEVPPEFVSDEELCELVGK